MRLSGDPLQEGWPQEGVAVSQNFAPLFSETLEGGVLQFFRPIQADCDVCKGSEQENLGNKNGNLG